MANIADWMEKMAGDEPIEAVVIGAHDDDMFNGSDDKPFNDAPIGCVVSWETAKPFLQYEFDNGYGGAECHPVYVWTKTWLFVISEYDGATGPAKFPRNPMDIDPKFG